MNHDTSDPTTSETYDALDRPLAEILPLESIPDEVRDELTGSSDTPGIVASISPDITAGEYIGLLVDQIERTTRWGMEAAQPAEAPGARAWERSDFGEMAHTARAMMREYIRVTEAVAPDAAGRPFDAELEDAVMADLQKKAREQGVPMPRNNPDGTVTAFHTETTGNWPLDLTATTFVELRDWANPRNDERVILCLLDAASIVDGANDRASRAAHTTMVGILEDIIREKGADAAEVEVPKRALAAINARLNLN